MAHQFQPRAAQCAEKLETTLAVSVMMSTWRVLKHVGEVRRSKGRTYSATDTSFSSTCFPP